MNIWVAFLIGLILGWIIEWFIDWLFWRRDRVGDAADLQASRADIVAPSSDVDVAAVEARWQQRMNEAAQQWQTRLNAVVQEQQARITALEEQNRALQAQLDYGARAAAPVMAAAAGAAVLAPPAEQAPPVEVPAARAAGGAVAPFAAAAAGAAVAAAAAKSEPAAVPADVWRGEYFNNKTLRGKPILVREDAAIDFDWTNNPPAPRVNPDQFSVRWTRMLDLPRGRYRFITTADDGVRLWVNDELLIDDWNDHPAQTHSREVSLPGGPVPVKMEYYENDFDSMVRLTWERAAASDLTKIRGIGPKFASLLTAAGVHTYDDLAALTPAQLEAIVQPAEWQRQQINFDSWIAQAAAMSRTAGPVQTGDDLTLLEGIGPTYAARLRENGIASFAQLAATDEETLARVIAVPAWRKINYADWIAQARLRASGDTAAMKSLQEELVKRDERDNLALIYGLGDKTAAALSGAGIATFAALAEATPEQLDEIMRTAGVRGGDYAAWIDEAKVRAAGKRVRRTRRRVTQLVACPQDLSAVAGIGSVYEDRLYTAGIGSYWELAETAGDELSQILGIEDPDTLGQIKSSAMQLAVQTNTLGRAWDGTPPDDFELLEGIGEVYERRLYEAGICTYEALAATTLERLQEICQAPEWNRPNYAAWIAKSTELAAAARSA
jgi:predicted flap endonuclease-1-like 5' DNA nuclease